MPTGERTSDMNARNMRRPPGVTDTIACGICAVLLAALFVHPPDAPASSLRAQAPNQEPAVGAKIRVDVKLALLDVTVKDAAGRVMENLKVEDFIPLEDDKEQKVSHFSRDQLPLAVALVVDVSLSMRTSVEALQLATQTALFSLKEEDEVALFLFHGTVERILDLTKDKAKVAEHLTDVEFRPMTNINDALYESARYLETAATGSRRVIVLVSDNFALRWMGHSSGEVRNAALEADITVYSLKAPGRNPVVMGSIFKVTQQTVNVRKLAEESGGELFDVEKEGSLTEAFDKLIERLKTRYTLGYYPTNHTDDGKFRKIEVRLASENGKKGKDYRVIAKSGYFADRIKPSGSR